MFKIAYLISDYLSFNCRNLCLGFDDMFMYVNWMIIVLLMWNLYAWMYIYEYVLFLCEIFEEWSCSCWIVNGFMIICCCCCFGMCCWWINALGILIYRLVMRIVVVVESLVKLCEIVELWWIDVLIFKFCESLSVFSCIWLVNILGTSFGHLKDQNLRFGVKKVWNPKLFDITDERSLERAPNELQTNKPNRLTDDSS